MLHLPSSEEFVTIALSRGMSTAKCSTTHMNDRFLFLTQAKAGIQNFSKDSCLKHAGVPCWTSVTSMRGAAIRV